MKINSTLLRTLRHSKNWLQEQLSEACGLSLRTIQRLENDGNASIESVRALAEVYDVDPSDIIVNENAPATTPFEAVKTALFNFYDFSGTTSRYDYGWFLLVVLFVMAIATIIHQQAHQVVGIIILLPLIAIGTRRLREAGFSGWWQLLFLVPFGQIVVFYLLAQPKSDDVKSVMPNAI